MNITQTKILKLLGLGIFFVFALNLFGAAPSASAYTCEKSGPNGNGTAPGGQKLEYHGGMCSFPKVDEEANDDRVIEYDRNGKPTGKFHCVNDTVPQGNSCYTVRPEYTTYPPTYDDGSEVPRETWDSICEKMPEYWGSGSHYNEERHACEAHGFCQDYDPDGSGGGCRKIGDGTATPEEIFKDTTKEYENRKNECDADKGSWDPNYVETATGPDNGRKGKCNVTERMCENKLQGEWKEDPATGQGTCEGGKSTTPQPSDPPDEANDTSTNGTCGQAKTVLLPSAEIKECDDKTKDGNADGLAIMIGILKFILNILTVGVGILAVGSIAYASVLYASARDSSSQTQQAIGIIRNTIIGLLLYIFMVAILNFLVPGGVIAAAPTPKFDYFASNGVIGYK